MQDRSAARGAFPGGRTAASPEQRRLPEYRRPRAASRWLTRSSPDIHRARHPDRPRRTETAGLPAGTEGGGGRSILPLRSSHLRDSSRGIHLRNEGESVYLKRGWFRPAPTRPTSRQSVGHCLHRAAPGVDSLDLAVHEKADRAAVGRPEGPARAFRSGHGARSAAPRSRTHSTGLPRSRPRMRCAVRPVRSRRTTGRRFAAS